LKVTEVESVQKSIIPLDKIDINSGRKIGIVDNFDLVKSELSDSTVYFLIDGENIIGAVITKIVETPRLETYLQTVRVYITQEHRGKNLAIKMYYYIKHFEDMNLMSDIQQTSEGEKLWQALDSKFDVGVMDTNTGEVVSSNIKDAYKKDSLVLVTETKFNSLIRDNLKF